MSKTGRDRSTPCAHVMWALLLGLGVWHVTGRGYLYEDEERYLDDWDELIRESYSAPLPAALKQQCQNQGHARQPLPLASADGCSTATAVQQACGRQSICFIPEDTHIKMDASLDVAAMIVHGTITWNDTTQTVDDQWLCSGFIAVESNGVFDLNVTKHRSYVYIKNNRAEHVELGTRAFGAVHTLPTMSKAPRVSISGRSMQRTWSLLAAPAEAGEFNIKLMHDPAAMGWRIGDRIVVAPTTAGSSGKADAFAIASFEPRNVVGLSGFTSQDFGSEAEWTYENGDVALLSAEVINLSRNVIMTGDDFEHVACESGRKTCTMGLHTTIRYAGEFKVQHTRVEKCGQRGLRGKYCMHFHAMKQCTQCVIKGNAFEFGHHRGVVVHGTHLSTVSDNVFNDVRGVAIFIEDGNEMHNNIINNVAICPWALDGPRGGCTIPGADIQADTALNQAGLWAATQTNNIIGNRFANSFNGMFYDTGDAGGHGRGLVRGAVCTQNSIFGRFMGNTFHGHGRFGTYTLGADFPKNTNMSLATNGLVDISTCRAFNSDGSDNGYSCMIEGNVDYHNAFVGTYDMGDVQLSKHVSIHNQNLVYWKTTKNFANGCASHIKDGYYRDGQLALPDQASFIIENTRFEGRIVFESNHHCNVGATGGLCSPTYVLQNATWETTDFQFQFHYDANYYGGIFTLAPPECANPTGHIFPKSYCSLVSSTFEYLLAADDGLTCAKASSLQSASIDAERQFANGIFCKGPLRSLKIWSRGQTREFARSLLVELWQDGEKKSTLTMPYHQIGNDGSGRVNEKQGYAFPVLPGLGYEYRISMASGPPEIPEAWVIEFSDPIFGNRWTADEIALNVTGRSCPNVTTSQHDRRFIYADSENFLEADSFGRGACTEHPDMPEIVCEEVPELQPMSCPDACETECNNGYCDCGLQACMCDPGFSGPNCEIDVCAMARCGPHGRCAAKYLGGTLPVSAGACVCEPGWSGPLCDQNACSGQTCSGNGTCIAVGDTGWRCECNPLFSGSECERSCVDFGCNSGESAGCNGADFDPPVRHYCSKWGGCGYERLDAPLLDEDNWCCYKNCALGSCRTTGCPPASNDCQLSGHCSDEHGCLPAVQVPDGTACNSIAGGKCRAGFCVGDDAVENDEDNDNDVINTFDGPNWASPPPPPPLLSTSPPLPPPPADLHETAPAAASVCVTEFGCTASGRPGACAIIDATPPLRHYCRTGGDCTYTSYEQRKLSESDGWCCFKNCGGDVMDSSVLFPPATSPNTNCSPGRKPAVAEDGTVCVKAKTCDELECPYGWVCTPAENADATCNLIQCKLPCPAGSSCLLKGGNGTECVEDSGEALHLKAGI